MDFNRDVYELHVENQIRKDRLNTGEVYCDIHRYFVDKTINSANISLLQVQCHIVQYLNGETVQTEKLYEAMGTITRDNLVALLMRQSFLLTSKRKNNFKIDFTNDLIYFDYEHKTLSSSSSRGLLTHLSL